MADLDYPVAAPDGVAAAIYRAQIIQAMALRFMTRFNAERAPSEDELTLDEAFDAAHATWGTDWETDPNPRTLEAAYEAVDSDLDYWTED